MRIITRILGLLIMCCISSSCITTQSVSIDLLEPGKVPLPTSVRKAAIIARNFRFSIDTLGRYYKQDFRFRKGSRKENQLIDSLSVTKSLDGIRKALLESGRFDEVYVYPFDAIKPYVAEKELPLTGEFIRSVCRESQTDAVISLEMLSFFYSRHKETSGQNIPAGANVKVTAIWAVYTPQNDGPIDRYTHAETMKWKEGKLENDGPYYKLPERKEAISIACNEAAKNYSKRVVPHWTESTRVIVGDNNPDLDKAVSYALKNKWEAAGAIWLKYSQSPNSRIAGISALNYAVAQEMLGDLELALTWSDKSVRLLRGGEGGKIAREYAAVLYQRKLKASDLNAVLKVHQK
ncbi:MAG: DUF6340 family protein [Mariniphaga sp.]